MSFYLALRARASVILLAFALLVAAVRGRLWLTCWRTVDLIRTGGANAGDLRAAGENNRFAYAPAIAVGVLIAVVTI